MRRSRDPTARPRNCPNQTPYIEGAKQRITANAYKRNRAARRRCLEHYGTRSVRVCGFDFEAIYSDLGKGFIHVHHLRPLAEVGEEYEIDPIADLPPVCPNCHALIHARPVALSIEELRLLIRSRMSSA